MSDRKQRTLAAALLAASVGLGSALAAEGGTAPPAVPSRDAQAEAAAAVAIDALIAEVADLASRDRLDQASARLGVLERTYGSTKAYRDRRIEIDALLLIVLPAEAARDEVEGLRAEVERLRREIDSIRGEGAGAGRKAARVEGFQGGLGFEHRSALGGGYAMGFNLSAMLALRKVNTAGHPIDEAAFLERVPYASGTLGERMTNLDAAGEADGTETGFAVRLVGRASPLSAYVTGSRASADEERPGGLFILTATEVLGVRVGWFVRERAEIGVHYVGIESFTEDLGGTEAVDTDEKGVFGKVFLDTDRGAGLSVEGSVLTIGATKMSGPFGGPFVRLGTSNTAVAVGGDYYLDRYTSFGGSARLDWGDDGSREGATFGVRFGVNSERGHGVRVSVEHFAAGDPGTTDDRTTLRILYIARM